MKPLRVALRTLPLAVALAALTGCTNGPAAPPKDKVAVKPGKSDSWKLGIDLIRQAQTPARYREGLQLLNSGLAESPSTRAKLALSASARKFLETTVALSSDELQEVESSTYRPAEAYYLAECFWLRDTAWTLEVAGLPAAEQADYCFRWVTQHVLLHEQQDDGLPPAFILRRGFGSARDRALVFLALMRQFQVEGGVLAHAAAPDDVWLVGVNEANAAGVRLFDPRLGMAVRRSDGQVATLKDAQGDAKLLQPSGLTAEQLKSGQWRLVCPLYSVSLRMAELERSVGALDRITLYLDAAKAKAELARATGATVAIWNSPAVNDHVEPSPTRALRLFLPPDEGGIDKEGRLLRFKAESMPMTPILLALEQIKIGPRQLVRPALDYLVGGLIADLIAKYELQPAELLQRGKGEDVTQRLQRIQLFLEADALAGLADDPEFQKAVAEWRSAASAAYELLARKDPKGQAAVNYLWGEDQYLLALLQVDAEERPERYPRKVVTRIVAHAVRDYLNLRARWLRAQLWLDKAEHDQLVADRAGPDNKTAAARAHSAWLNARVNWRLYTDKGGLGPFARQQRLEAVLAQLQRPIQDLGPVHAARLMEALHLDLHRHYVAQVNQARALHFEGAASALTLLRDVDSDLGDLLEKNKTTGEPGFKGEIAKILTALPAAERKTLGPSLELLQHDWAPQGNFYWLRQRVRRQIELWDKKA